MAFNSVCSLVLSIVFFGILTSKIAAQQPPTGMMNMSNTGNFNLSTLSGVLGFVQAEGIDPTTLIMPNCIRNGDQCSTTGGQACCLSPVFTCQTNRNGSGNACYVIPTHAPHIPQIKQIVSTLGLTTDQPIQ